MSQTTLNIGQTSVAIRFIALTNEDSELYRRGVPIEKLGVAFSGIVDQTTSLDLTSGDRVIGYSSSGGCVNAHIICDNKSLVKCPSRLPLEHAVLAIDPWVTAIQLVKHSSAFKKRERLAIYHHGDATGIATTQLAQLLGCRRVHHITPHVLGTAEARKYVLHGALPDEVVAHTVSTFKTEIAKYDPKGLEVIIDRIGLSKDFTRMLRPGGRLVWHSSSPGMFKPALDVNLLIVKNIRVQGSSLRSQKPVVFQEHLAFLAEHILPKFISQQLTKPQASRIAPESIPAALKIGGFDQLLIRMN